VTGAARISAAIVAGVISAATTAAVAAPPVLVSAGSVRAHPAATWSLPSGVRSQFIEVARSPEVGADGSFLEENVRANDRLAEGQTSWVSTRRIAPGTFYVHVAGIDWPCFMAVHCPFTEWSAVRAFTVKNQRPTLSALRARFNGRFAPWVTGSVRLCDVEEGRVTLLVTQRRFHRGRRVAIARSTQRARLVGSCDRQPLFVDVPRRLLKSGDVYRIDLRARDEHGALSNIVSRGWRTR
jgi:hypothetical protein